MRKEKKRFFTKKGAEKFAQDCRASIIESQYSESPKNRLGIGDVNRMVHVQPSKKLFRRWSVYAYPVDRAARMRAVA